MVNHQHATEQLRVGDRNPGSAPCPVAAGAPGASHLRTLISAFAKTCNNNTRPGIPVDPRVYWLIFSWYWLLFRAWLTWASLKLFLLSYEDKLRGYEMECMLCFLVHPHVGLFFFLTQNRKNNMKSLITKIPLNHPPTLVLKSKSQKEYGARVGVWITGWKDWAEKMRLSFHLWLVFQSIGVQTYLASVAVGNTECSSKAGPSHRNNVWQPLEHGDLLLRAFRSVHSGILHPDE